MLRNRSISGYPPPPASRHLPWDPSASPPPHGPIAMEMGNRRDTPCRSSAWRPAATRPAEAATAGDRAVATRRADRCGGSARHDHCLTLVDAAGDLDLLIVGEAGLDGAHLGGALAGLYLDHLIA